MIEDLLIELNTLDEHPNLEAKACGSGCLGDSFFETVCAFSNEPGQGGGRVVLGVSRAENDLFGGYEVNGVQDSDKLQQDIASGCSERFNIPLRPRIIVEDYQEKTVLIVEVEERASSDKPVYFKNQNLPRGAWRRIGSSDQRCTEDDLVIFYGSRQGESYDRSIITHADLDDLDPDAIDHYRKLRSKVNSEAEELEYDDLDLLRALNAVQKHEGIWKPTLTGLLLFGKRLALRRELPMMRVDYIRVPGKEWVSDPDQRFETTIDMRGPLLQLVDRAAAAVMDDLPKGFELQEGHIQAETPTLPAKVIREAIVNALMHRSYREHQPTQIIRYSNRIEIKNAGFSLKNEDALGEPGSEPRNPTLAAVFHETNTAETKGSGIRTMRRLMEQNGFSLPTFESNRADNFFVARLLLHHFLSEEDIKWLEQIKSPLNDQQKLALIFIREQGAIDNQTLRQLTGCDVLASSNDLRKLRDLNLLEQKGKGSATYYLKGKHFPKSLAELIWENLHGEDEDTSSSQNHTSLSSRHTSYEEFHTSFPDVTRELWEKIRLHENRVKDIDEFRSIIKELCSTHPRTVNQLCLILNRKGADRLKRDHLTPMRENGELSFLYPDMEKHPQQAYRIPE